MTKREEWVIGFLGVTFTAVAMEVFSVVDGLTWTRPWTDLIVGFLPAGVGIPLVIGFSTWLCVHFISRWLGHPVMMDSRPPEGEGHGKGQGRSAR